MAYMTRQRHTSVRIVCSSHSSATASTPEPAAITHPLTSCDPHAIADVLAHSTLRGPQADTLLLVDIPSTRGSHTWTLTPNGLLGTFTAPTVGPHFFETMCPTAFLAPTLTAKTCFICAQPQNAFFLAKLALQGNRSNGKKSFPGRVLGQKKEPKWFQNLGRFKKNSSAQRPKKVPKIGPAPGLA